jgi:F-type H+-transporting ATPase subunit b
MIDAGTTSATTQQPAPAKATGGFPPFDQTTFPSQLFWLAITFAILFVVMWRVAGPRINGAITNRRNKINGDLAEAQKHRGDAEGASAAYQAALAGARARANALADENRKHVHGEIEKAKADAEARAHEETAKAEARIAATREQAKSSVVLAAQEAAITIVQRLTGETVDAGEAAAAVQSVSGG